MADRGQITGGILDGPLALDNAISLEAAKIKKIDSPVAGRANVLVVPDLEAGNMLAKSLSFLAGADAAGIVLGARVPIILTSRADSVTDAAGLLRRRGAGRRSARREAAAKARRVSRHDRRDRCVLNAGSSSIKFSLFARARRRARRWSLRGQVEGLVHGAALRRQGRARATVVDEKSWGDGAELGHDGRARPPGRLPARARRAGIALVGVGHRVVHGGARVRAAGARRRRRGRSAREVRARSRRCTSRTTSRRSALLLERAPELPQVACFDTAFHRTQPRGRAGVRAAARESPTRGVRRYGFHGLSYEYIASRAAAARRRARRAGKTVVAAPRQRRQHVRDRRPAAASRARWASPRSTACRWARAAARSIPA